MKPIQRLLDLPVGVQPGSIDTQIILEKQTGYEWKNERGSVDIIYRSNAEKIQYCRRHP